MKKEMNKRVRLVIFFLAMFMVAFLPKKVSAEVTGFYEWWTLRSGDVEIKKYTGGERIVKIPSRINGKPVTSIREYAFQDNKYIEQVVIPSTVRSISYCVFQGSSLKSVTLPDTLESVHSEVFADCPNLEYFDSGNGVKELRDICKNCPKLKTIRIGKNVEEIDGAFRNDTALTAVTIPGTVKGLNHAFSGCTNLSSVNLQEGIEYLTSGAFEGCAISSITLPNSITSLNQGSIVGVFKNCANLKSVTLSNNLESLPESVFKNCSSLLYISIPPSVRFIDEGAFAGCSSLSRIDFSEGLETIYNYWEGVFEDCTSLTSLTFPKTLKEISVRGLLCSGCTSLKTVTVPKSVTEFGSADFPQGVVIQGWAGSKAQEYYTERGYQFVVLPDVPASSFTVQESNVKMNIGGKYSLHYSLAPAGTTDCIFWESSNTDIVEVTALGKLIAKKEGSVSVIATTSNGIRRTLTVVVQEAPKKISFAKDNVSVMCGKTYTQKAKLENGRTDFTISYESSNPNVASVNALSGTVTAKKAGTAKITASISTGLNTSYTITVTEPPKVQFTKKRLTIGAKEAVRVSLKPSAKATYVSNRPDVVSVNGQGRILGKKAGSAVITAKASYGRTARCTVTVKKTPKNLKLNKTKLTLKRGKTFTLKPRFTGGSYSYKITYRSSKASVVSVYASGKVKAKKKGTAKITAKTFNGKTASCKVTVK